MTVWDQKVRYSRYLEEASKLPIVGPIALSGDGLESELASLNLLRRH